MMIRSAVTGCVAAAAVAVAGWIGVTTASAAPASASAPPDPARAVGSIDWGETRTVLDQDGSWPRLLVGADPAEGGEPRRDLLTYTTFEAGEPPTIVVTESTDDQRTWRTISEIPSPPGTIQEQAFTLRLDDGTLLMATRFRTEDLSSYSLPVFTSSDGGTTWERVSSIDDNPDAGGAGDRGVWEPFLTLMPGGCVSALYANETHADEDPPLAQTISQRLSCDGGRTWGEERFVASSPGDARPGMPGLARLADGRWITTLEACVRDDCNVHYKTSRDGTTWAPGLGTQIPDQNAGPYVTSLTDGRVLVTSACTNEVSISADEGATWYVDDERPFDITCADGEYPYTWPALYQVDQHTVVDAVNTDGGAIKLRYGSL